MKTIFVAVLAFAIGVTAANLRAQTQVVVPNTQMPCVRWSADNITCETPPPYHPSDLFEPAIAMGYDEKAKVYNRIRVDAQGRVECAR